MKSLTFTDPSGKLRIRAASPDDAAALLEIYAPYVRNTAITFEYEVPDVNEFRGRIERTLLKYPYLAAEIDGVIVGYAYASSFHPRAAYDWCAEASIYVHQDYEHHGIGRALYEALEELLQAQGILNLNACIAVPEIDDDYLTHNSADFHAHMGFQMVGQFHRCGYKFNRWYHMIWMEKELGPHLTDQPPIRSFPQIRSDFAELS